MSAPLTLLNPLTGDPVVVATPAEEYRLRAQGYHEPHVVPAPVVPPPVLEGELRPAPEAAPEPADEPEAEHEAEHDAGEHDKPDEDKGKRRR